MATRPSESGERGMRPGRAPLGSRRRERHWDRRFRTWIEIAEATGLDANDVGDREWGNSEKGFRNHYAPYITPDSVVLELGPGSGRYTRFALPLCREMILVDYSHFVGRWLARYLRGKGRFRIVIIDKPVLSGVADASVDFAFANGVFEHLDLDDMSWLLEELARVVRPAGMVAFDFDNIMSPEGRAWHRKLRGAPGDRCIFRFHHPETVAVLAEEAGFEVCALTGKGRFSWLTARRREAGQAPRERGDEDCGAALPRLAP
jgi:SAM-dependent methyltransferase